MQPDLYDAPTLDQPSSAVASSSHSAALLGQQGPLSDPSATKTNTHFTTVDEEARRQLELGQGNRWVVAAQLSSLLAALGLLGWGGWQLMQPPTADALFTSISAAIEEQSPLDLSRDQIQEIESFFDRFADDPRAQALQPLREQLEFQKVERRARAQARFAGVASRKPIESVYFEALAIADEEPTQAVAMLRALLALYDPTERIGSFDAANSLAGEFSELGDPRLLVTARQRIEQLQEQLQALATAQLPALQARLALATKLRPTDPRRAQRMYQAIVQLYSNQAWAGDVVNQAQRELGTMTNTP
jgi:hypothetical protein